jgi:hypothetical protein
MYVRTSLARSKNYLQDGGVELLSGEFLVIFLTDLLAYNEPMIM